MALRGAINGSCPLGSVSPLPALSCNCPGTRPLLGPWMSGSPAAVKGTAVAEEPLQYRDHHLLNLLRGDGRSVRQHRDTHTPVASVAQTLAGSQAATRKDKTILYGAWEAHLSLIQHFKDEAAFHVLPGDHGMSRDPCQVTGPPLADCRPAPVLAEQLEVLQGPGRLSLAWKESIGLEGEIGLSSPLPSPPQADPRAEL